MSNVGYNLLPIQMIHLATTLNYLRVPSAHIRYGTAVVIRL
jgi:hypothetical protein